MALCEKSVPKNEKLRAEIIRLHYDMPVRKHGGQ